MAKRTKEDAAEWAKDKAANAGRMIIDQFTTGNLPEAMAPSFLYCGERNADRWKGWTNKLLVALSGHADAATFSQWKERGRRIKKGEHKSVFLFRPMVLKTTKKNAAGEDEERSFVRYTVFGAFGIDQTEIEDEEKWAKFAPDYEAIQNHLESLPLKEVAKAWGIKVGAYTGKVGQALGYYMPTANAINVGVEDHSTWAHELVHAADDRNGKLNAKTDYDNGEVVAELGGCILLTVLGYDRGADRGGAFRYIQNWSKGKDPVAACRKMLDRACEAVALILATAESLKDSEDAPEVENIAENELTTATI